MLLTHTAWSQPTWEWVNTYSNATDELANDVAAEPLSGDNYTVGNFTGSLTTVFPASTNNTPTMTAAGNQDGLVVKNDINGNFIWAFKIGSFGANVDVSSVELDPSGNIYIAGYFEGVSVIFTGTTTSISQTISSGNTGTSKDFFLAKYNSDGELLWVAYSDCDDDAEALDIAVGSNGVYITGYYTEDKMDIIDASATTTVLLQTNDAKDPFIAAFDLSGNHQWSKRARGSNDEDDIGTAICTNDNHVFVTGAYNDDIDFFNPGFGTLSLSSFSGGSTAIFIASYDASNGSPNWVEAIGNNEDNVVNAIATSGDLVFIGGSINDDASPVNFPGIPALNFSGGGNELFTMALDTSTLVTSWVNVEDNDNLLLPVVYDLEVDPNGFLVYCGRISGTTNFGNGTTMYTASNNDLFVAANDINTGSHSWLQIASGPSSNERATGVAMDNAGNFYISSRLTTTTTFGILTASVVGGTSASTARLTGCPIVPVGGTAVVSNDFNCIGNNIMLTLTSSTGNIQWQSSNDFGTTWSNIVGGNTATINFSLTTDSTLFRAELTTGGCTTAFSTVDTAFTEKTPPTFTCLPSQTAVAATTCDYFITDYTLDATLLSSINDNCGAGNVSITQKPIAGTNIGVGADTVVLVFTDQAGNSDSCRFEIIVAATVNPILVSCGDTFLGETTNGSGNNGNNFSCAGYSTPAEDNYYQLTVPNGNHIVKVTINNVVSASNSFMEVIWVGSSCPGSTCLESTFYNIGAQNFQNGNNFETYEALGPGTYFLVIDAINGPIDSYDITFDCIQTGIAFDETCPGDIDGDGIISTVDGSPVLEMEICDNVTVCQEFLFENPGFEWLDSVEMQLGPCYTNVVVFSPTGTNNGFYNTAGTWANTYSAANNHITWDFTNSVNPTWGDGAFGDYSCESYNAFCFNTDIASTCLDSSGLSVTTVVFDDGTGNAASTTQSVDIVQNATFKLLDAPAIINNCPTDITVNSISGQCNATASWTTPTVADECPGTTIAQTSGPISGSTFPAGATTIEYTATEPSGNTVVCSFMVIVIDQEAPSISCPGNQTGNANNSCQFIALDYTGLASVSDNCSATGDIIVTQSPAIGSALALGTNTITLTAADTSGNTSTCTFNVVVSDITPPIVACLVSASGFVDANCNFSLPNYAASASGTDNCGSPTITQSPIAGTILTIGNTTITITATDGAGNTDNCSFVLTVSDTIIPNITCLATQTEYVDATCSYNITDYTSLISASDNCSTITLAQLPITGTALNLGSNNVTIYATDGSGNIDSCSFTINVLDTISPAISCPAAQTEYVDANCQFSVPSYLLNTTGSDNCGTYFVAQSPASGNVLAAGTTPITMIHTDASGNSSGCSFNLIVLDTINPILLSCPTNIVSCDTIVSWTLPTASDNCASVTITPTSVWSPGDDFPVGLHNVSYDISDASGNTVSCLFTVEILPEIDPVFSLVDTLCLPSGPLNLSTGVSLNPGETDLFYSDSSQVVFNGNSLLNPVATGPGTYPITHVVSNGVCSDSMTNIITLIAPQNANFSNPSPICANDLTFDMSQTFLPPTTPGGYWLGGSFSGSIWDVSALDTIYNITYIVGPGQCADTISRMVGVLMDADPTWNLVDTLCVNASDISLPSLVTGTPGGNFTGPAVIGQNFSPSSLSAGTYTITYSAGVPPCNELQTETIVLLDIPVVDAGLDQLICGDSATLDGSVINSSSNWLAITGINYTDDQSTTTDIVANNEGDYTLILEADNGYCVISDDINISFFTLPSVIDAGQDQELDYLFNSDLDGLFPDFGNGTWTSDAGQFISTLTDPLSAVNNLNIGDNMFIWSVENGVCPVLKDTIVITVNDLVIPSGFSPNGDMENEFFEIPGIENSFARNLKIFNRWGNLVYQSDQYNNNWDGTNMNGEALQDDTYFYILITQDRENSGYVIIKRQ